jgi:hypothetical protein
MAITSVALTGPVPAQPWTQDKGAAPAPVPAPVPVPAPAPVPAPVAESAPEKEVQEPARKAGLDMGYRTDFDQPLSSVSTFFLEMPGRFGFAGARTTFQPVVGDNTFHLLQLDLVLAAQVVIIPELSIHGGLVIGTLLTEPGDEERFYQYGGPARFSFGIEGGVKVSPKDWLFLSIAAGDNRIGDPYMHTTIGLQGGVGKSSGGGGGSGGNGYALVILFAVPAVVALAAGMMALGIDKGIGDSL